MHDCIPIVSSQLEAIQYLPFLGACCLSFCKTMEELAVLPCMQGDYHSSKQRPGSYALICRRQEAAGAAAHALQPSAQAWEAALPEMSRRCREARDARQHIGAHT